MGERYVFESEHIDGLWVSRFIDADPSAVVRVSWAGLDRHESYTELDRTPWTEFAVNNCNREEVAFHLGLAWRLTLGRSRWIVPTYYRDQAAAALQASFELVRWEYRVNADAVDPAARFAGFRPARAAFDGHRESDWARAHKSEAGLFTLTSFDDLVAGLRAALSDAQATVALFGTRAAASRQLVATLRASDPPVLADVLAPEDVFVAITIGVDMEYHDSILVASRHDHRAVLATHVAAVERSIATYEMRAPEIASLEEFIHELGSRVTSQ